MSGCMTDFAGADADLRRLYGNTARCTVITYHWFTWIARARVLMPLKFAAFQLWRT